MQALGPDVVAERPPRGADVGFVGGGQRRERRVLAQPLVILGQHAIHLGLLQHHFRHQHVVRIGGVAPREVPPVAAIPAQEVGSKPPALGRMTAGGPLASAPIIPRVKIYTKTGDAGETSFFDGSRVSKADLRVDAYGEVDELNACLGAARGACQDADLRDALAAIQQQLFAVGRQAGGPVGEDRRARDQGRRSGGGRRAPGAVDRSSRRRSCRRCGDSSSPAAETAGAWLHVARTVCRRAERRVVGLGEGAVEPIVVRYLNRLSDLLFVMARAANHRQGVPETEW